MESRTEINNLGEFGLIDRIKSGFKTRQQSTILGINDDAAIIDTGKNYHLLSTDMLLEGVHFDLSYMPLQHLGYKAISVNVSDIAAMNGIPRQVTVSIGLSNRFSVEAVDALYEGIKKACETFEVDLVGGDTTSSRTGLVISVSVLGEVEKKSVVKRNTANTKDIICVTGDLGGAYIGLQVLEREKQEFQGNPDMQPQLEELKLTPTAMIDVSDGLASDLMHICSQSKVGAVIYEDKLPIDQQTYQTSVDFKIDPVTCVLNGGEDYELLFTIRQEDFEKLKNHPDIHFIGYIQEEDKGINLVTKSENVVPIQAQGWNHFKK